MGKEEGDLWGGWGGEAEEKGGDVEERRRTAKHWQSHDFGKKQWYPQSNFSVATNLPIKKNSKLTR